MIIFMLIPILTLLGLIFARFGYGLGVLFTLIFTLALSVFGLLPWWTFFVGLGIVVLAAFIGELRAGSRIRNSMLVTFKENDKKTAIPIQPQGLWAKVREKERLYKGRQNATHSDKR